MFIAKSEKGNIHFSMSHVNSGPEPQILISKQVAYLYSPPGKFHEHALYSIMSVQYACVRACTYIQINRMIRDMLHHYHAKSIQYCEHRITRRHEADTLTQLHGVFATFHDLAVTLQFRTRVKPERKHSKHVCTLDVKPSFLLHFQSLT